MKSFLYRAQIMHNRTEPKKHRFHYNVFLFCLDLDAMEEDFSKLSLISRNKFNLFSFYDKDHVEINGAKDLGLGAGVRDQMNYFLKQNGIEKSPVRILLVTNLRMLGYVFNPVSFYYCFDEKDQPICAVAEVSNTFKEMKMYFLGKETFKDDAFHLRTIKHFYVSPFIDHDAEFDFHLNLPSDKLNVRIDDYKENRRFFVSTLTGKRRELTSGRLLSYFFRFPFITLQIIFLIHWNAFLLWLKKIHFHKKGDHSELQKNVLREYKK